MDLSDKHEIKSPEHYYCIVDTGFHVSNFVLILNIFYPVSKLRKGKLVSFITIQPFKTCKISFN